MLIFGGVGIDMENGMVTLTVQAQRAGMDETMIVLQAQGRTTSEAMSNLSEETGKVIVTSQNLVFAVGQSFMEQGRAARIDSCARQLRVRPDVLMLLSETTAADIMNARDDKGELIPLENLRSDNCLRIGFVRVTQIFAALAILAIALLRARPRGRRAMSMRALAVLLCAAGIGIAEWAQDKTNIPNAVLYAVMIALCVVMALCARQVPDRRDT